MDLLLVSEILKVRRFHAFGNERVSTSRQTDLKERSDRTGQVQRGAIRIRAAVFSQLTAEEMQERRSVDVLCSVAIRVRAAHVQRPTSCQTKETLMSAVRPALYSSLPRSAPLPRPLAGG